MTLESLIEDVDELLRLYEFVLYNLIYTNQQPLADNLLEK